MAKKLIMVIILNCASLEYFLDLKHGTCVFVNCISSSQKKCGSSLPLKGKTAPREAAQKMGCPLLWMGKIAPHAAGTKKTQEQQQIENKKPRISL